MKIKVNAEFGGYNREFEVSCGTGKNKTFKWLSNVVCQRFALAAPNGALRHRDHFRGISESAQHTAVEISLSNGQIPHPAAIIADFLRDGDSITVKLIDNLKIDSKSGNPVMSKWASVAFTTNSMEREEEEEEEEEDDVTIDEAERRDQVFVRAKSDFMRVVLGSQMLNTKQIERHIDAEWNIIAIAMPKLPPSEANALKKIFQANWSTLVELFQHAAPRGTMSLEEFRTFVDDIGLFAQRDATVLSNRVYNRSCQASNQSSMSLGCLIVALLLCGQLRHNDTFEYKSQVHSSTEAIQEIFNVNIIPCAERLSLPTVLKGYFCSDEVLFGIRNFHDDMFCVFERFASRSHQLPTSLKIVNLTECLHLAGLLSDVNDVSQARWLFEAVRSGAIKGRDKERSANLSEAKYADDPIPEDELTFPEFVEVSARAGYYKFYEAPGPDPSQNEDLLSIPECLIKGVRLVVNTLNKKIP